MSIVQRFTRDRVSRFVWIGVTLILAAVVALSVVAQRRLTEDARAAAQTRAIAYSAETLQPSLAPELLTQPITGDARDQLMGVIDGSILTDPRVVRVRIWAADGRLLFSTDHGDRLGSNEALNNATIASVTSGAQAASSSVVAVSHAPTEFQTYSPLVFLKVTPAPAAAEIDQRDNRLVGDSFRWWRAAGLVAGAAALFTLLLTLLSLRTPLARIGAGVKFVPESVPEGLSVVESERLEEVDGVVRRANERAEHAERDLKASEETRRTLEGELQRTLSLSALAASQGVPGTVAPTAADELAFMTPIPAAEPLADAGQIQEKEPAIREGSRLSETEADIPEPISAVEVEQVAAEGAGLEELASVEAVPETPETVVAIPEAEAVRETPEPVVALPEAEAVPETPEPVVALPEAERSPLPDAFVAAPRSKRNGRKSADKALASVDETRPAASAAPPAVGPSRPSPKTPPGKEEAATDVLDRLVVPVAVAVASKAVDPGELRARLARTAARKKPSRRDPEPEASEGAPRPT